MVKRGLKGAVVVVHGGKEVARAKEGQKKVQRRGFHKTLPERQRKGAPRETCNKIGMNRNKEDGRSKPAMSIASGVSSAASVA